MTPSIAAYYDFRVDDPRFFEMLVPEQIEDLYAGDSLGRDEVKWVTQVFK